MSEQQLENTTQSAGGLRLETGGSLTVGPNWAAIASLGKKMANVMGELKTVLEDSKHPQGWKYASYSAVATALREALSSQSLGLFANLIKYEQQVQGKGLKSIVEVEFTFADGETGAMRTSRWAGEAVDFGSADKGLNKAYTAAEKYFLMRTFLVSTSDDVEPDASDEPPTQVGQNITRRSQPEWEETATESAESNRQGEPQREQPIPDRPYSPERVKRAILSRATKGSQLVAKEGFRGLICGNLEAIWVNQRPDARVANRHSVLNFLFADASSEKLTTGQCNALVAWLMEKQPVGPDALNPYAVAEANAIVNLWNENAGQQPLEMPSELAADGVPSEDIPI